MPRACRSWATSIRVTAVDRRDTPMPGQLASVVSLVDGNILRKTRLAAASRRDHGPQVVDCTYVIAEIPKRPNRESIQPKREPIRPSRELNRPAGNSEKAFDSG